MKGKSALVLMEMAIMLLVLALAAALCLQAFVWADAHSRENSNRDQAMTQLQSAAEVLKVYKGDITAAAQRFGGRVDDTGWTVCWDENWDQTKHAGVYCLSALPEAGTTAYLGSALLELRQADGTVLGNLRICWQEVLP